MNIQTLPLKSEVCFSRLITLYTIYLTLFIFSFQPPQGPQVPAGVAQPVPHLPVPHDRKHAFGHHQAQGCATYRGGQAQVQNR